MADNSYLHYETVTPLLKETLGILMSEESFAPFRLVGGTCLPMPNIAVSIFGYSNAFCNLIFHIMIAVTQPLLLDSAADTTSDRRNKRPSNLI